MEETQHRLDPLDQRLEMGKKHSPQQQITHFPQSPTPFLIMEKMKRAPLDSLGLLLDLVKRKGNVFTGGNSRG